MKAWIVNKNGAPAEALTLEEVADPVAATSQPTGANVLVRVTHAALNPADLQFMQILPSWLPFRRRPTPGLDFAGEVVKLGPQAAAAPAHASAPLTVGTRVAGCMSVPLVATGHGGLAEAVCVPAELLARVPDAVTSEVAPGLLGCAGQTAMLVMDDPSVEAAWAAAAAAPTSDDSADSANSKRAPRVLVNGASGGVGSFVVQIAKARGAHVVGVCSAANAGLVQQRLGADAAVDYRAHDPLPAYLTATYGQGDGGPFDVIVDCVGDQALYRQSPSYLAPRGGFVSIVGGPSQGVVPFVRNKLLPVCLGGTQRTFKMLGLFPSGARARAVAAAAAKGAIHETPIDSVYPMAEVIQAYEKLATKRAKGKVVIKVQE